MFFGFQKSEVTLAVLLAGFSVLSFPSLALCSDYLTEYDKAKINAFRETPCRKWLIKEHALETGSKTADAGANTKAIVPPMLNELDERKNREYPLRQVQQKREEKNLETRQMGQGQDMQVTLGLNKSRGVGKIERMIRTANILFPDPEEGQKIYEDLREKERDLLHSGSMPSTVKVQEKLLKNNKPFLEDKEDILRVRELFRKTEDSGLGQKPWTPEDLYFLVKKEKTNDKLSQKPPQMEVNLANWAPSELGIRTQIFFEDGGETNQPVVLRLLKRLFPETFASTLVRGNSSAQKDSFNEAIEDVRKAELKYRSMLERPVRSKEHEVAGREQNAGFPKKDTTDPIQVQTAEPEKKANQSVTDLIVMRDNRFPFPVFEEAVDEKEKNGTKGQLQEENSCADSSNQTSYLTTLFISESIGKETILRLMKVYEVADHVRYVLKGFNGQRTIKNGLRCLFEPIDRLEHIHDVSIDPNSGRAYGKPHAPVTLVEIVAESEDAKSLPKALQAAKAAKSLATFLGVQGEDESAIEKEAKVHEMGQSKYKRKPLFLVFGGISREWPKEKNQHKPLFRQEVQGLFFNIVERDIDEIAKKRNAKIDWGTKKEATIHHLAENLETSYQNHLIAQKDRVIRVEPTAVLIQDISGAELRALVGSGQKINHFDLMPAAKTVTVYDGELRVQIPFVDREIKEFRENIQEGLPMWTVLSSVNEIRYIEDLYRGWKDSLYVVQPKQKTRLHLHLPPSFIAEYDEESYSFFWSLPPLGSSHENLGSKGKLRRFVL